MSETWYELARDARKAAGRLVGEHHRSFLSRAYYAAYSKVTFDLSGIASVTFPTGKEGPRHPGELGIGGIRRLIESNLTTLDGAKRKRLSELIGRLYTLRLVADYRPSIQVDGRDSREAISIMNTIFDSF